MRFTLTERDFELPGGRKLLANNVKIDYDIRYFLNSMYTIPIISTPKPGKCELLATGPSNFRAPSQQYYAAVKMASSMKCSASFISSLENAYRYSLLGSFPNSRLCLITALGSVFTKSVSSPSEFSFSSQDDLWNGSFRY